MVDGPEAGVILLSGRMLRACAWRRSPQSCWDPITRSGRVNVTVDNLNPFPSV